MITYFAFGLISIVAFVLAKKYEFGSRIVMNAFLIISVVALILPASVRDISVGTDVFVYQIPFFEQALSIKEFSTYIAYISNYGSDYGYYTMVYFIAKIFGDIHVLFFVEEVIAVVPVYFVIWEYRDITSSELCLLLYFTWYLETYNTIRQQMAMSLIILSVFLWQKRKRKKWFITLMFAITFHITAVIGILFPIILWLCQKENERTTRNITYMIVGVIIATSLFFQRILRFLINAFSFFPKRFLSDRYLTKAQTNFPIFQFTVITLSIIAVLLCIHNVGRYELDEKTYLLYEMSNVLSLLRFLMITLIVSYMGVYFETFMDFGSRIFWYFQIYEIFSFGLVSRMTKNDSKNRSIVFLLMTFIIIFYLNWIHTKVNPIGIFPYRSLWK